MEQRLAEFRARRKKQAVAGQGHSEPGAATQHAVKEKEEMEEVVQGEGEGERKSVPEECGAEVSAQQQGPGCLGGSVLGRWLGWQWRGVSCLTVLKLLLWMVLLALFSELQFGLPFFLLSLFYWLYEGLRSPRERRPGELSAYSVFNPQCQALLGTLTAQQLEGEMGYRPLGDR